VTIDIDPAFWLFSTAGAIGAGLAFSYLRGAPRRPPWPIGIVHGALGAAGLAALLLALRNGLPASAMGTAGFGPAAAVLLGIALLLGLVIGFTRRRPPGVLVAVHASVAIAGFVVLWTVVSLG
jgi:asparagine N-glycosylation enzyme membrane subunit Stt3